MPSHYEVLGLDADATAADVKTAYRKLIRTVHPDLVPEGQRAEAASRAAEINDAYAVLSDPGRRADYDRGVAEPEPEPDQEPEEPTWGTEATWDGEETIEDAEVVDDEPEPEPAPSPTSTPSQPRVVATGPVRVNTPARRALAVAGVGVALLAAGLVEFNLGRMVHHGPSWYNLVLGLVLVVLTVVLARHQTMQRAVVDQSASVLAKSSLIRRAVVAGVLAVLAGVVVLVLFSAQWAGVALSLVAVATTVPVVAGDLRRMTAYPGRGHYGTFGNLKRSQVFGYRLGAPYALAMWSRLSQIMTDPTVRLWQSNIYESMADFALLRGNRVALIKVVSGEPGEYWDENHRIRCRNQQGIPRNVVELHKPPQWFADFAAGQLGEQFEVAYWIAVDAARVEQSDVEARYRIATLADTADEVRTFLADTTSPRVSSAAAAQVGAMMNNQEYFKEAV